MNDDIVERLRESAEGWDECDNEDNAALEREAADEIERLRAEVRRWVRFNHEAAAEIERLRAVLRTIADVWDPLDAAGIARAALSPPVKEPTND